MPLPLASVQNIAPGLVYTPPDLRRRAFNDMAPAFGIIAADLDNQFARVEQNYPAARCCSKRVVFSLQLGLLTVQG